MGGLFSAPKPSVVAAPPPAAQPTPETAAAATEAAARAAGAEARAENRARAPRGIAGMIATSPRGVLQQLPGLARKSLLGE